MADIKNYLKEREKREQNQIDYRSRIRKHRLTHFYRIALVVAALAVVAALVIVQYNRHIYTGYDVVSSIERDASSEASDIRLGDSILTYSKDGVHCTDTKGNVKWNQTYEIQNIKMAVCQNTVAIGGYNERSIYIQNTSQQLGTITTTMPIRDLTVSAAGKVTAVLADTDVTWINTYEPDGTMSHTGQTRMENSGYPVAVSLSPNGELLAVSYLYVDAGIVKTNVAFYNFGIVGDNYSDMLVGVHIYTDMVVPVVRFMNDTTAFAVGDSRLMIYKDGQKPVPAAEYLFEEEVQSVFYNEQYVGLVFLAENEQGRYRLDVYNTSAAMVGSYYFDIEYTDLFFHQDYFVAYNETECMIKTFAGVEKYNGYFSKSVNLMLPANAPYKYILVTDQTIDTIQLR